MPRQDKYTPEKCWLCGRTQAEVDRLGIKQTSLLWPTGVTIEFSLRNRRIIKSRKKDYPDLDQSLPLWLCPICAHITFEAELPPPGRDR